MAFCFKKSHYIFDGNEHITLDEFSIKYLQTGKPVIFHPTQSRKLLYQSSPYHACAFYIFSKI